MFDQCLKLDMDGDSCAWREEIVFISEQKFEKKKGSLELLGLTARLGETGLQ